MEKTRSQAEIDILESIDEFDYFSLYPQYDINQEYSKACEALLLLEEIELACVTEDASGRVIRKKYQKYGDRIYYEI